MSDEIQDTPAGATKGLFGALAFILLLLGAEMMLEKDGARFWIGLALGGCGFVCTYAAVFWNFVRQRLPGGTTAEINAIATSPRWWLGVMLLGSAAFIFSPFVEQQRWPFTYVFGYGKAPLPVGWTATSLRLQFNASGARPQEIEARNIEWTWATPTRSEQTSTAGRSSAVPKRPANWRPELSF
jgi:hypothetical protein